MKNIHKINNNIYITNDEPIKEGDWYLYCNQINKRIRKNPKAEYPYPNYQKIILTNLVRGGVQSIDDEFLEWFVKNPSCEEVEVNFIADNWGYYKIIIPQEEPKQETLEEAAERLQKDKYGIFISKDAEVKGQLVIDTAKAAFLSGMTEGAKWQQDMADNWITMKEGDITVNFKPMPEFDEPAYPTRLVQLKEQAWDVIYQEFIKNTDGISSLALLEYLKDNYNPPTKKQDNDNT